jgi:hypothetical protein
MYFFKKGAIKAMDFLETIYNAIYYVGIQTLRYGKRFFRWLLSLLLKPVKAFVTLIFTFAIVINKHALKAFHNSFDQFENLIADAKKVSFKGLSDNKDTKKSTELRRYLSVAKKRYKGVFEYVSQRFVTVKDTTTGKLYRAMCKEFVQQ